MSIGLASSLGIALAYLVGLFAFFIWANQEEELDDRAMMVMFGFAWPGVVVLLAIVAPFYGLYKLAGKVAK